MCLVPEIVLASSSKMRSILSGSLFISGSRRVHITGQCVPPSSGGRSLLLRSLLGSGSWLLPGTGICVIVEFGRSLFYGDVGRYRDRDSARVPGSALSSSSCIRSLLMGIVFASGSRRGNSTSNCFKIEFGGSLPFFGKRVSIGFDTWPYYRQLRCRRVR